MYETFFGLESSPFGLTPDPRFLFRSNGHHDILSSLLYGVTTNKGIMLLLGDVGMGKTTLCRALLRELPAPARGLFLLNPHYSETELVGAILDGLGLERRGSTRGALMTVLEEHLLAAGDGDKIVIVVDEAQQLSVEALEQLRIISTLEAPDRKLLHIVLAGQPELEDKLARPELRQLDQRIAVRCRLEPLSERETLRYIEHRLRAAGCGGRLPFTPAAGARVHRCSRGVPRVINHVCDRALVAAYADRRRDVDVDTVNAAIISLRARRPRARWRPDVAVAAAAVVAGLIVISTAVGLQSTWRHRWLPRLSNGVLAWAAPRPAPATVHSSAPVAVQAAAVPAAAVPLDLQRRLLAELIALWIRQSPSRSDMAEWPSFADGTVDIAGVAKRYQLTATGLPRITAAELRAIGLPALVRLDGTQDSSMLLLRHIGRDTVTFVDGAGTEHRRPFSELESTLAAAEAWIVWQNLDQLVLDRAQPTPTMVFSLALRLHMLGYLAMPLPRAYDSRLAEAVRAFQRSTGLADDGIPGPRTILALYRVVASTVAPSIPSEGRR